MGPFFKDLTLRESSYFMAVGERPTSAARRYLEEC